MNHIYLAGPHVFLPTTEQEKHLAEAERILNSYQLSMVAPPPGAPGATPESVAQANLVLLEDCDGVIADLTPFRGAEPDSGTVFELAYAIGRGMPALGYSMDERPYAQIVAEHCKSTDKHPLVEDHGYPLNLMLVPHYHASFEACVKMMASMLVSKEAIARGTPLQAIGG